MSSEEQAIIEDEPLKVLGLFHKRDAVTISFDQEKFLRLFDSLCCTICRELFNNPVYLRCSHRFCKECIEKYIRFNQKKSCPNCRGDLNTKRDLRTDYNITTLIRYAYGDRQKFIEDMTQIQNAQVISLQRSNSKTSVARPKPFIDDQQKVSRKKVKLNQIINVDEISQHKTKRRKSTTKSFDSNKQIEQLRTQEIRNEVSENMEGEKHSKSMEEQPQIKMQKIEIERAPQQFQDRNKSFDSEVVKMKKKRGRKKQVPIIEVKSQSSEQNPQPIESIPMEVQEKYDRVEPPRRQYRGQSLTQIKEKVSLKNIQEANEVRYDPFEKQRNLLKQEFGSNYMLSVMKIPTLDFLFQIKLEKHPHCFLTPPIACKSIQLSSKAKIHNVFVLMSKLLNLPIKNIQISANSSKITPLPYSNYKETTIGQLNEDLWKSSNDVQVFDMKEILSSLEETRCEINKEQQLRETTNKIKLFEGIEFEKDQRSSQPRKRGRGRAKRIDDKENSQEIKEEAKRTFYYKIVSE